MNAGLLVGHESISDRQFSTSICALARFFSEFSTAPFHLKSSLWHSDNSNLIFSDGKAYFWSLCDITAMVCMFCFYVRSSWYQATGFTDFLNDNCQTFVYHSKFSIQFFCFLSYHLLRSASCANHFCWFWLIFKHPYGWFTV